MMIEVTTMMIITITMMTQISATILNYYFPDLERKIIIKKLKQKTTIIIMIRIVTIMVMTNKNSSQEG